MEGRNAIELPRWLQASSSSYVEPQGDSAQGGSTAARRPSSFFPKTAEKAGGAADAEPFVPVPRELPCNGIAIVEVLRNRRDRDLPDSFVLAYVRVVRRLERFTGDSFIIIYCG